VVAVDAGQPALLHHVARRECTALSCRIENPSQDAAGKATMTVNEEVGIVTVQAGVPQRDLLDYLANYS